MARKLNKTSCCSISNELLFKILIAFYTEGNVHSATVFCFYSVAVVVFAIVDVVIKHAAAGSSHLAHLFETALLQHVRDIEASHVNSPAARRVLEHVSGFAEQGIITHKGDILARLSLKNLVLEDHNRETARTDVLLSTDVYHIKFLPLHLAGGKVAAHVANNELALGNHFPGKLVELKALDSFVLTEVEEGSILFNLPFLGGGDRTVR
jgi:hypothetical protein